MNNSQLKWDVAEIKEGIISTNFMNKRTTCDTNYFSKFVTECKQRKRKSPSCSTLVINQQCSCARNYSKLWVFITSTSAAQSGYCFKYFNLFRLLKKNLSGNNLDTEEELKMFVNEYLVCL